MTTRAGTIYRFEKERMTEDNSQIQEVGGSGSGIATSTSTADVMRMFMEERQQREAQQAEERRKWEMEMERRDGYNNNIWKCCSLW